MNDQALDNVPSMEQPVNFDFSRIDAPKPDENFGLFKVKPANEWIDGEKLIHVNGRVVLEMKQGQAISPVMALN